MSGNWHILTGEYPPAQGGVADYTFQVAGALAAGGDSVHVWCPTVQGAVPLQSDVEVHQTLGALQPGDILDTGRAMSAIPGQKRLLVQWVPHAFEMRAVNVPFCLWVLKRRVVSGDAVDLMIHEPFLGVRGSARQRLAGIVQRVMMVVLLLAATRVWVAVPQWWQFARPFGLGRRIPVGWLPVPSNVPLTASLQRVSALRSEAESGPTVGHFGSFGSVTDAQLIPILEAVMDRCPTTLLRLIGRGALSAKSRIVSRRPDVSLRILVSDGAGLDEVASQIAACDVMIQPYLDGVSTRRTSLMAGLALGIATVTHEAECTEPIWRELDACVMVVPTPEAYASTVAALLTDEGRRLQLGERARRVYDERFHLRHIIERLQQTDDNVGTTVDGRLLSRASGEGRTSE